MLLHLMFVQYSLLTRWKSVDCTFNASPSARFHLEEERTEFEVYRARRETCVTEKLLCCSTQAVCFWRPLFCLQVNIYQTVCLKMCNSAKVCKYVSGGNFQQFVPSTTQSSNNMSFFFSKTIVSKSFFTNHLQFIHGIHGFIGTRRMGTLPLTQLASVGLHDCLLLF